MAEPLDLGHHGQMPEPSPPTTTQRLLGVWNVVNLATVLGLAIAALGRARISWGPGCLVFAQGYRPRFPAAGAFTVGNVVISSHTIADLERWRPGTIAHEAVHARQWAAFLGLPFLPCYLMASTWSWLRTGDPASDNPFERHAGLLAGGYRERPITWAGWRTLTGRDPL